VVDRLIQQALLQVLQPRGRTVCRERRALGARPGHAASVAARTGRWWRHGAMALNAILTVAYVDRLGVPRLA
jgi:RNA-directed DNA polymerase